MAAGSQVDFASIIDAVLPPSQFQAMKKYGPGLKEAILNGLRQAQLPNLPLDAGQCTNKPPSQTPGLIVNAGKTATGILTTPAAGTSGATVIGTSAAIPIIGGIIAAALSVFGVLTQKHAVAVKKEQITLCNAVPQANGVLLDLDQRVAAGHVDLDQAFRELDGLAQGFRAAMQPILKQNQSGSVCNAACGYIKMLDAQVLLRKRIYTDPDPTSQENLLTRFLQLAATGGAIYAAATLL